MDMSHVSILHSNTYLVQPEQAHAVEAHLAADAHVHVGQVPARHALRQHLRRTTVQERE